MKKNNNIKQLKEIVNNELFFDLNYQGVQAYNISGANEYEVIVGFRKCNGRYYFIDRNRNKYLASRYDREEDAAGELYMIHRIESAKDEEDSESEETAAACEPSRLAGILAKMKNGARKVCEKVALIMALAFVMVVAFTTLFGLIYFIPDLLNLFGIECGSWAAIALSLLLFCTVIIDTCVFVELNTMAAIDHFFPSLFGSAQKPGFTKPFCFWYRLINESL